MSFSFAYSSSNLEPAHLQSSQEMERHIPILDIIAEAELNKQQLMPDSMWESLTTPHSQDSPPDPSPQDPPVTDPPHLDTSGIPEITDYRSSNAGTSFPQPGFQQQGEAFPEETAGPSCYRPPRPVPRKVADRLQADPFINCKNIYGLNKCHFEKFLERRDVSLVMFYDGDKTCEPPAQYAKKHFIKASKNTKRKNHSYAAVDCSKENEICNQEQATTFPCFKLYSRGQPVNAYRDYTSFDHVQMKKAVELSPVATAKPPGRR